MKIKQTDKGLKKDMNKYSCYFMSIAYAVGKEFTAEELNYIWDKCISLGYISGDQNFDNDLDDKGEAEIQDPNGVAKLLGAKLIYINQHVLPTQAIPDSCYAIGRFFNPRTGFGHFVVIDKNKNVVYDPLGNSITVRDGYLESMRLFKRYQ